MTSLALDFLIIDPQWDFMDTPFGANQSPALAVPGATASMQRLAALVRRLTPKINDVHVTMDSHRTIDVGHAGYWVDSHGRHPNPFTQISAADIESGLWSPRAPSWRSRALAYARELEARGKYQIMVWPTHCLIGSAGHAVQDDLALALRYWEETRGAAVDFVTKGTNVHTEHYSAVMAEVPDPSDPSTGLNGDLIDTLGRADLIAVGGEALSHCLLNTVEDIANNIGEEHIKKLVLLTDCTDSIPAMPGCDFPAIAAGRVGALRTRGMKVATSFDFLA
jgi:nicotinamidase/pyrazinamidase